MTIDLKDVALEGGDHVVLFYEQEDDLFEVVGQHLARVARAQETSIVIASETHRQGFEAELEFAGIDVVETHRAGRLVMVDAAATMTQFMVAGQIDRKAFRSVLEGILDDAFEVGRKVHVYGEMVSLLWDAGEVMAAIELESLWNDLIGSQHFSLLCSYPHESVAGPEHAEELQQICHLHSSVVRRISSLDAPYPRSGVSEWTADFAAEPNAPGATRRFVHEVLQQWCQADEELVNDAAFVASELATNAVVHAGTAFCVGIRILPAEQLIRLSVRDASPLMSTAGDSSPVARTSWGLRLVADLASCWGVETTSDAKVVWAEFALASS
jgi:hypothetical protein